MSLICSKNLEKTYRTGDINVAAIKCANFTIDSSAFVSFVGPSGSGKSTLLNMIGCLDRPTGGKLTVFDTDVATLNRKRGADFRAQHIGFIFQDFNLIPVLSVFENIEYPLIMVQKWPVAKRIQRVNEMLEAVNMADQARKLPSELSGGQKQRVAIARALVTRARLILADEPTANLDHATAYHIIELMKQMRDEFGSTFIFSTHDQKIMEAAEIIYTLEDGAVNLTKGGMQ